jgi:hypothetical protein
MSVNDPSVVDVVGIDKVSDEVVLTIADAWDWEDCNEHLLLLQEKINRYIGFIEQELIAAYPNAEGRPVRIDVLFMNDPVPEALGFLSAAGSRVRESGWSFRWRVVRAA